MVKTVSSVILGISEVSPVDSQLADSSMDRSQFQVTSTPIWNDSTLLRIGIKPFSMRPTASSLSFLATEGC